MPVKTIGEIKLEEGAFHIITKVCAEIDCTHRLRPGLFLCSYHNQDKQLVKELDELLKSNFKNGEKNNDNRK